METADEIHQASLKLHTKNLDAIVLNSLNDPGAGFGDTNQVTLIYKMSNPFALQSKKLAHQLWEELISDVD